MPAVKRIAVAALAAFGLVTLGAVVASASTDDATGEFGVAASMVEYATMTEY